MRTYTDAHANTHPQQQQQQQAQRGEDESDESCTAAVSPAILIRHAIAGMMD
jgi:hypothetical protein